MVKHFIAHRVNIPRPAKAAIPKAAANAAGSAAVRLPATRSKAPREIGGPDGPEPTRFGDWERKGICIDF
jgi:hypothetical protein